MFFSLGPHVASAGDVPGFNLADTVSSEMVTFAFGVLVAFVIPWLTVLVTKRVERLAAERVERLAASVELINAAGAFHKEVNEPRGSGSYSFRPIELNAAVARILILTRRNRAIGAQQLEAAMAPVGRNDASTKLGLILGDWAPRGRFRITDQPHRKLARWSTRSLRRLFRTSTPDRATSRE